MKPYSRILLILPLLMLTLTACIHAMPANQTINTKLKALYFASSSEDISTIDIRKQADFLGIEIVHVPLNMSIEEVIALTKDVIILYLESEIIDDIDDAIYQDWLNKGKMIVALDTQMSRLTAKMKTSVNMDDLVLQYKPDSFFVASFFQSTVDNGVYRRTATTNFYPGFLMLDRDVRISTRGNDGR